MRLEGCFAARLSRERKPRRRSARAQQPRREAERTARQSAVEFCQRVGDRRGARETAAEMLSVSGRTLSEWERRERADGLCAKPRGRPLHRSSPENRNALIVAIRDFGPHTGVETLRSLAPPMPRSEITDVLRRYRAVYSKRRSRLRCRLEWTTPGAVWAMDYAEPPALVGETHRGILAVRDLATGEPLLWRATPRMRAEDTIEELQQLFAERGPPLVLKNDNGPPFRAEATEMFLADHGVYQLFSPIWTPSYNGACESTIRHLKQQTEYEAQKRGAPGLWDHVDLERARAVRALLAGCIRAGRIDARTRAAFVSTVESKEVAVRQELKYGELEGDRWKKAKVMRIALSRALVEHGLLHIRRRRIPLPDCSLFPAEIS